MWRIFLNLGSAMRVLLNLLQVVKKLWPIVGGMLYLSILRDSSLGGFSVLEIRTVSRSDWTTRRRHTSFEWFARFMKYIRRYALCCPSCYYGNSKTDLQPLDFFGNTPSFPSLALTPHTYTRKHTNSDWRTKCSWFLISPLVFL